MKKNISRLIATIEEPISAPRKASFKINTQNAHKYTNKILVNAQEYYKPSSADLFVLEEMKEYGVRQGNGMQEVKNTLKVKTDKQPSLIDKLTYLEIRFSFLVLQQVMSLLKFSSRQELLGARNKLVKLQNSLSFKLESQLLQPHLEEAIEDFLKELSEVINKTSKVY